jgi:hypothetical protein
LAGALRAAAFFTATFFDFGAADFDAVAFDAAARGAADFAAAFFGAAFFAVARVAFFGAAFFAVARVVFAAAFFGAARVAFFGAAFRVATFVAAGFAAFLAAGFFGAAVLFAAAFFGAAFLVAALTASAMALGRVVFASLVTCRNSFFAVLEDADHSNGCSRGPFRNMQTPRGWTVARVDVVGRGRHAFFRRCCAVGCACPGLNCGPSTVPSQWRAPAVACFIRVRIGHAHADSAIRVSLVRVNKKRPLLAVVAQKSAPRHCCRGARWVQDPLGSQRREIGTKGTCSGPM